MRDAESVILVLSLAEKQKALENYAETAQNQSYVVEAPKEAPKQKQPVVWQISPAKIKELQWKRAQLRQFEREKATRTKTGPSKDSLPKPKPKPKPSQDKSPAKLSSSASAKQSNGQGAKETVPQVSLPGEFVAGRNIIYWIRILQTRESELKCFRKTNRKQTHQRRRVNQQRPKQNPHQARSRLPRTKRHEASLITRQNGYHETGCRSPRIARNYWTQGIFSLNFVLAVDMNQCIISHCFVGN